MNEDILKQRVQTFQVELQQIKEAEGGTLSWYPYGTLSNFEHLKPIFAKYPLDYFLKKDDRALDIGAADGDLAFFLESLGYALDIVDNGPTNYNGLKGARFVKAKRNSNVGIYEIDLDSQFSLPGSNYRLIFFLGILYHLKNPFYVLEALSRSTKHMIMSTRVARFTPDGTAITNSPLAYLVGATETNNDATNFWIFSDRGLRQILQRTGWDVVEMYSVGDTTRSNPRDPHHDERVFALLRSRRADQA